MMGLIALVLIGSISYCFHAIAIEALLKDIVEELRRKRKTQLNYSPEIEKRLRQITKEGKK